METISLTISKEDHKIIPRTNLKWNGLSFKNWKHIALLVIHIQSNTEQNLKKRVSWQSTCDSVIKRSGRDLFCYCNWKIQVWVPVPMLRKEVYSGAMRPGRMVDFCLKDQIPFLLKPTFLIGIGRRGAVFYPIILLAFGAFRSCPSIFLSLGMLSVRVSPVPSWCSDYLQ